MADRTQQPTPAPGGGGGKAAASACYVADLRTGLLVLLPPGRQPTSPARIALLLAQG